MARLNISCVANESSSNMHMPGCERNAVPRIRPKLAQYEQNRARPQRSLKLQHVDSLTLAKLPHPYKPSKSQVRASERPQSPISEEAAPPRKAKLEVTYRFADDEASEESANEDAESARGDSDQSFSDDCSEDNDDTINVLSFSNNKRLFRTNQDSAIRDQGASSRNKHEHYTKNHPTEFSSSDKAPLVSHTSIIADGRPSSSSSAAEQDAIIRFSPPRSKKPALKSSAMHTNRPATPPQTPPRSKLISPKKQQQKIPPTPHRPSIDAFWSPGEVNLWNEEYSPRKTLKSPRKFPLSGLLEGDANQPAPRTSPCTSPQKSEVKKATIDARKARREFEKSKHTTAEAFFRDLDDQITQGKISKLAASAGGVKVIWSKTLNTTAGRAHWRRQPVKVLDNATLDDSLISKATEQSTSVEYRHFATIELAEKIIDDESRLLNTLAHEFCHLANYMVSGIRGQPHGASFKRWAALVSTQYAARGVVVTTKHSYEIKYKYTWMCCNEWCGIEYSRHSRSIDPKKHTCGECKGRLVQIRPAPRKAKPAETVESGAAASSYQQFVKENFRAVRSELGGGSPMKEVMREIGVRYQSRKEELAHLKQNAPSSKKIDGDSLPEIIEIQDGGNGSSDAENADPSQKIVTKGNGHDETDKITKALNFFTIKDD